MIGYRAFLQRIVNSGGRVEREYGLGRMRTDLLVIWPVEIHDKKDAQKIVLELKVLYRSLEQTITDFSLENVTINETSKSFSGTVTNADLVNSIPDPAAVFLLGSACLIGFSGLRRKFKK